ncbi:MAG: OmpA family protein [Bacteroidales bacterium]|nr:OmpA family protein [Bacteroidales bacterium]
MKSFKITLCILIASFLLLNKVQSQESEIFDKFSLGLNFGSLLNYGDIKQFDWYPLKDELKWGGGAVLNYQISPIVSLQLQGLLGNVSGVKRTFRSQNGSFYGEPANLKFDAQIYEGSLNTTVSLSRWFAPKLKCNKWLNVYAMAGLGLVNFRTQLRNYKTDAFIKSFGWSSQGTVKEKMTTETVFTVGLGTRIRVSKKIDINLEASLRNLNSDKFDAYVRPNNANDKYGYTSIGIVYRFGKRERHMEWALPSDLEQARDVIALDGVNRRIDELNNKVSDLENKLANLPQPVETTGGLAPEDLQRLAELNQKLNELDEKNRDLNNRIVNLQGTTTTTQTIVSSDGTVRPVIFSVFFDVNKSDIDRRNHERIAEAARMLIADPSINMELVGHADKTGGQRYNELLSERRAKAVRDILVSQYGIATTRLTVSYKGFSTPLSNSNYDVNRRVDFLIK